MLTVLIADDSDSVRARVRDLVADVMGVTVIGEVSDGGSALAKIERAHPDVVILDIRMPRVNGFEVLEALGERAIGPMVIVLTAFAYPQYREKCLKAGAAYFFDKTTEFERVTDVLNRLAAEDGGAPAPRNPMAQS